MLIPLFMVFRRSPFLRQATSPPSEHQIPRVFDRMLLERAPHRVFFLSFLTVLFDFGLTLALSFCLGGEWTTFHERPFHPFAWLLKQRLPAFFACMCPSFPLLLTEFLYLQKLIPPPPPPPPPTQQKQPPPPTPPHNNPPPPPPHPQNPKTHPTHTPPPPPPPNNTPHTNPPPNPHPQPPPNPQHGL